MEQLKRIVSEATGIPVNQLHDDLDLITQAYLDSLSMLDTVMTIEEYYGFDWPDNIMPKTFGDIRRQVAKSATQNLKE